MVKCWESNLSDSDLKSIIKRDSKFLVEREIKHLFLCDNFKSDQKIYEFTVYSPQRFRIEGRMKQTFTSYGNDVYKLIFNLYTESGTPVVITATLIRKDQKKLKKLIKNLLTNLFTCLVIYSGQEVFPEDKE